METAADAEEQLFSSVESALESAANQLETALQRAAKAVEDALTGIVGGFEELTRQMDLTSKKQEEYLTKTNQGYELNKMQRTLSKDIDKTDNKSAKAKLANFSKELRALQEKDKLSKLELEIAQKKYDLLKAQIALEESQNAKSTVRLTRDNEGNYGYVYVAQVAMGADYNQFVKAVVEAEAYDGPSLIIAYAPCINHGIKEGMGRSVANEEQAVKAGYWHLYRHNPVLRKEGKNPFSLDSKEPTESFRDFLMGQVRYSAIAKQFPEEAEELFTMAEESAKDRLDSYKRLAD